MTGPASSYIKVSTSKVTRLTTNLLKIIILLIYYGTDNFTTQAALNLFYFDF